MAKKDTRKKHPISNQINSLLAHLRQRPDLVVVPTDKTNSYVVVETAEYTKKVIEHLNADAVKTTTIKLNETKDEAKEMLNAHKDLFSPNEFNYIKSTINNCDIPSVKLLIKDHKDSDEKGNYPSQLVVPAKNFTAGFQHVGQRGIKAILDRNNVNYQRKTIIQASHLKERQLGVLPID